MAALLEGLPFEQQSVLHILAQIAPAVAPGAQNEFVGKVFSRKRIVQNFGAFLETVAVLVAAIKIEPQAGEALGMLGQGDGTVRFPVALIKR